jgi:exonuclease SbcC
MIEYLTLRNFQNHRNSRVDFVDGLTVISGSSDNGKSSILRAISWVVFNRPTGSEFITRGENVCEVTLKCTDAPPVTRVKSRDGKKNYYMVGDQKLKAMGQTVPEEVTKVLGINEVNIQPQFSDYFLLQESPGEVAKFFNQLTNLDVIDRAFLLNKRNRGFIKHKLIDCEEQVELNTEFLKNNYQQLPAVEKEADALEADMREHGKIKGRMQRIRDTLDSMGYVQDKIEDMSVLLGMEEECSLVIEDGRQVLDAIKTRDRLLTRIDEIKERQDWLTDVKTWLAVSDLNDTISVDAHEWKNLRDKQRSLSKIIDKINHRLSKVNQIDTEIEELTAERDEVTSNLDVCPTCGRDM